MASNESKQNAGGALKDEILFTIEASVVTGFEETARGEAKELFNTDVKAARGKITWSIPYNRIQDVLKMGSIDNFKVVMHSVKPFHFTDQHESLAKLQKMVADVDWESGLKVWRLFNDFPHPIPAHPEVVPSPEELVEVVIMNNLPAKKSKEEKKFKKGGNWKKKKAASKGGKESRSEGKITAGDDSKLEPDSKTEQSMGESTLMDPNLNLAAVKLVESSVEENFRVKPLDETAVNNVEIKPIDETGANKVEVKPLKETVGENVEVKPLDETGVNNVEVKPLDETGANKVEVKPLEETVGENVEVKPLDETVKPLDETGVNNVEVKPIDETGAKQVEVKPLEETVGENVEVKPLDETAVNNVEVKPIEETVGENFEVKPLDEAGVNNVEVKPLDETGANKFEVKPLEETVGENVEVKPLDETVKPLDEAGVNNVEVKPLDETGANKVEVKPLEETVCENVEVKPLDETGANKVEVKPLEETLVENVEVKPLDETGANKVEVKLLEETLVENVEVKPLDETGANKVEVKSLEETLVENVEVKPLDETGANKFELKPLDETGVNNVEVKPLDETGVNKVEATPLDIVGENVEVKPLSETGVDNLENKPLEVEGENVDIKSLAETEVESVEVKLLDKKEVEKAETAVSIVDCKFLEDSDVSNVEVKLLADLETDAVLLKPAHDAGSKLYKQEPKTVIIKRREDWDKDTKIDIKVLLPNPDENIFPSKLTDKDDRIVEPMDIDPSVSNANLVEGCTDQSKAVSVTKLGEDSVKGSLPERRASSLSETEFASNIIKRLTSPPGSQVRTFESEDSPRNTGTPPPTPTHYTASLQGVSFVRDGATADSLPPVSELASELPGECAEQSSQPDLVGGSKTQPANISGLSLSPSNETEDHLVQDSAKIAAREVPVDSTKPKFRVTCNRNGDSHPFNSPTAAASFGSAVNRYHQWIVDLNNFDIEVVLDIDHEEVSVGLGLTKASLHKRNLVVFGPTTLRATICYNMLRLCRIKNGDVICDPMCGSGALPIEGAVSWTKSYHLGGDNHKRAIERTVENVTAIQNKMKAEYHRGGLNLDVVQWDIEHFPLRDKMVDVFISDLPFGHRLGNRTANRTLYPNLLTEMARTAATGARACLLTEDKGNFIKAVNNLTKFWQRRLVLNINIGGLSGFVFLLTRTSTAWRSHLEALNDTSNIADQAADLGCGDSCRVAAADNPVTGSSEPAQVLTDDAKISDKNSSQENCLFVPCEGNLFCE